MMSHYLPEIAPAGPPFRSPWPRLRSGFPTTCRATFLSMTPASIAMRAASSRRRFFSDKGDQSSVYHQPETAEELLAAEKALISCPTASIGSVTKQDMRPALAALPELVEGDVYRCGYASETSFGAISYLIR